MPVIGQSRYLSFVHPALKTLHPHLHVWGLQHGAASMQEALCGLSWRLRSSSTTRIYKRTVQPKVCALGYVASAGPSTRRPELAAVIHTRVSGDATSFSIVSGPRTSSNGLQPSF
jgi:hypothetical protein